jgi:hypothetical protein
VLGCGIVLNDTLGMRKANGGKGDRKQKSE